MYKSVYDTNNNWIVDNSEALNWQAGSYYLNTDNHTDWTTNKVYTATEQTKLSGIEAGAEVNNISDIILKNIRRLMNYENKKILVQCNEHL